MFIVEEGEGDKSAEDASPNDLVPPRIAMGRVAGKQHREEQTGKDGQGVEHAQQGVHVIPQGPADTAQNQQDKRNSQQGERGATDKMIHHSKLPACSARLVFAFCVGVTAPGQVLQDPVSFVIAVACPQTQFLHGSETAHAEAFRRIDETDFHTGRFDGRVHATYI